LELSLRVWPAAQHPLKAIGAAGLAVGVGVIAGVFSDSPAMGSLVTIAIVLSMWRLWAPVRVVFGPLGVVEHIIGVQRRIPWREISGYELRAQGALLQPHNAGSPLRGLYIFWGRRKEEVVTILDYYLSDTSDDG